MLLSVVVPCHNEERTVRRLSKEVDAAAEAARVDLELVFVDDGSTDATLAELRDLAAGDPRVRFVSFSRNFGKESAMLAGLAESRGDAVVIMDADLQHPPELLADMVERYRRGAQQVVARRSRLGDPPMRSALARAYYLLINRLVDVRLVDGVGDFRLLSRRAVDALLALPEYNRFSKGLFAWIGFEPEVIDYPNVPRSEGRSTWSLRRLANYGLDGLLSFNNRAIRLSIWLGLAVTSLSFAYVVWLLVRYALHGVEAPGYITLVTAVLGLGGVQLVFLGILGEYVGRIYYEVKRRPHYVVRERSCDVAPD